MATSIWTSRPPPQAVRASTAGMNQRRTNTRLRQGWHKAICLLGLLQLVPQLLTAQADAIRRLFPSHPTNYLTDVAGLVDQGSAGTINDLAARLRRATGAELAVVTLPTIGDYAPGDVALNIGRTWGVGAKGAIGDSTRNAGVVLLLVPRAADHKGEIYLSTGRGIEGIITDATAGRITDLMLPDLRDGNYGAALVLGTRAIASLVAKGLGVSDSALAAADPFAGQDSGGDGGLSPMVVLIIIVIFVVLSAISRGGGGRGGRRGPSIFWGGSGWGGGGWGGGGFGGGSSGGGFGGFGGGGGFSGGGAGRSF
jgi:uncharacterized protein